MPGRLLLAILMATAACGGGSGDDVVTIDAPSTASSVTTVDCAMNAATATVVTQNFLFSPMATTINVGQIVKFQLEPAHDVGPDNSTTTDPGLSVGFGGTACLKFAKAGTFGFMCTAHLFKGSITVQ